MKRLKIVLIIFALIAAVPVTATAFTDTTPDDIITALLSLNSRITTL